MNIQRITMAIGAITLLSSLAIHAEQLDVKTGLWETTSTTAIAGMMMPSNVLNSLPPERRAAVEAAMKAREAGGPKSHTEKTCITKEDLAKPFDKVNDDSDCKSSIVSASSTHAEYKIDCTGPEVRTGTMRVEALSQESIKSTMKMNTANGAISNETTSKWIATDCGNVQ